MSLLLPVTMDLYFIIKTTSDEIAGTGTSEEVNNAVGTAWGAKDASIRWDY